MYIMYYQELIIWVLCLLLGYVYCHGKCLLSHFIAIAVALVTLNHLVVMSGVKI